MGVVDILITVMHDEIMVDGLTEEGKVAAMKWAEEILTLEPDTWMARIPDHLTIGIKSTDEVYILRRPGLH